MAEDAGEWIEEKLGDGDGKHEWKDEYSYNAIVADIWIFGILEKSIELMINDLVSTLMQARFFNTMYQI